MKRILIVFFIMLLAAFSAVTMQRQQNTNLELRSALEGNDTLENCVIKCKERINRDARKISGLKIKVDALTVGQSAK